jgi:hypothetical protein
MKYLDIKHDSSDSLLQDIGATITQILKEEGVTIIIPLPENIKRKSQEMLELISKLEQNIDYWHHMKPRESFSGTRAIFKFFPLTERQIIREREKRHDLDNSMLKDAAYLPAGLESEFIQNPCGHYIHKDDQRTPCPVCQWVNR